MKPTDLFFHFALLEKLTDAEVANVSAALAHSLAQLKVKRRNRP